jgi:YHS domain-containing protein
VVTQPGARVDQRTYCPVSGVVFKVTAASPKREAGGQPFYFCCEACAAYFAANQDRVLALRGLAPARR